MSDFKEKVSILLGLIALSNSPCLSRPPVDNFYQSPAVYSIIGRLAGGGIENAFRIYNFNGDAIQGVIYSHLLFITNHGYEKYKQKLKINRFFR